MDTLALEELVNNLKHIKQYGQSKNVAMLKMHCEAFLRLPLMEYGQNNSQKVTAQLDKAISILIKALVNSDTSASALVFQALNALLWYEQNERRLVRYLKQVLPVLNRIILHKPQWLLMFFNYALANHKQEHPVIVKWLADLAKGKVATGIPNQYIEAAQVFYGCTKKNWHEVKFFLFSQLNHEAPWVRAFAARALGQFYYQDSNGLLESSFKEALQYITEREIERPGVAAAFFHEYYANNALTTFATHNASDCKEWLLQILAKRSGIEPDLQPCIMNIEAYVLALFTTKHDLRNLIKAGYISLAYQSALNNQIDFKAVLLGLLEDNTLAVIRSVAYYLALYYGTIHPQAQALGMLELLDTKKLHIIALNFDTQAIGYQSAIVMYPKVEKYLIKYRRAQKLIETFLPGYVRGEEKKQLQLSDDWLNITYQNNSWVHLQGTEEKYRKIVLLSDIPAHLWRKNWHLHNMS